MSPSLGKQFAHNSVFPREGNMLLNDTFVDGPVCGLRGNLLFSHTYIHTPGSRVHPIEKVISS